MCGASNDLAHFPCLSGESEYKLQEGHGLNSVIEKSGVISWGDTHEKKKQQTVIRGSIRQ